MKIKTFFYKHPVFRYETFVEFMKTRGIKDSNTCRKSLQYHINAKNIVNIKKGLYGALNPMTDTPESYYVDPYLIAGTVTNDAVLAYHTALEIHDLAYTTFEAFTYLTHHKLKEFVHQGQKYKAFLHPAELLKRSKEHFAIEVISRSGLELKVTSLERTIVDIIDRPELGGGWEEIWRSLEHLVTFNINKLIEYVLLLDNATTIAKAGFFLEKLPELYGVRKETIDELTKYTPKQPCYLERSKQEKGKLIKKWNLIVPEQVLNQTWEERYATNN